MTTRCDQPAGEPDDEDDGEYLFGDDEGDDEFDIQDEIAWLLRPRWLHPDCRDVCNALELGTCCKYPDNPLVRVAVDLAGSIEGTLGRFGEGAGVSAADGAGISAGDGAGGGCAGTAAELARLFRSVPGLLAQVHAILPRLDQTAVAQLLCPVGSLAGALEQACGYGCPWACHDPGVPDRRAELEPLRQLLAECSAAIRTALGWPSG
jgi:hypothetical protein